MAFYVPSSLRKRPLAAAAATIALISGVAFTIQGPQTGVAPAGDHIAEFKTGSGSQVGYITDTGHLSMSGTYTSGLLLNCNTIDTTSTGMLICGTDEGGEGSGITQSAADARYVNTSGDTMTGALLLNSNLTVGDASGDSVTWNAGTMTLNNTLNIDSNTFVLDPSANRVGIGIASPTVALDVVGAAKVSTSFIAGTTISGATLYGAHYGPVSSMSATGSLTTAQFVVLVDATASNMTLTLPACSSNSGKTYLVKKTDSSANNVILDGNGAETIDGQSTVTINYQYTAVQLVCNGTSWFIF